MVIPAIIAAVEAAPLIEAGAAVAVRSGVPLIRAAAAPVAEAVVSGVEATGMAALRSGGLIGRIAGWMGAGNGAIAQGGIFSRVAGSLFGRNAAVATGEMVGAAGETAAVAARAGGGFLQSAGRWLAGGIGLGYGGVMVLVEKLVGVAKNPWVLGGAAAVGGAYLAKEWLLPSDQPAPASPGTVVEPASQPIFPAAKLSGRGVESVVHEGRLGVALARSGQAAP